MANANERIFLSPPFLDGNERKYVDEVFASNYIAPCGPMVDRFERELASYVGVPNAAALSSATSALDLLCDIYAVGPGDVVFVSDVTFVASVAPAVHSGATPVFIGCDEKSMTMDPALLEEALADAAKGGKLPKLVVAVDLYGQCCDYSRISGICEKFGVTLIEDSAESLGAEYLDAAGTWKKAGNAGAAAIFSFNGNKIITTSGGGMLVSNGKSIVDRARFLSQQARDPFPWYEHTALGYNYRMSNVTAAIGVGQLERLDAKVERKRVIRDAYRRELGLEMLEDAPWCNGNAWLSVARLSGHCAPETLRQALEMENIESRALWKPMHMQPVFKDARCYGREIPERLFADSICLPSGAGMNDEQLERVIRAVKRVLE